MKKENIYQLTPSMEDYLEMVYRLSISYGYTRINELAYHLNVQPPSVTRMIQRLASIGLVIYEKYGVVRLTESGKRRGSLLLQRHNLIKNFLKAVGITVGVETETEKIEHTISNETLLCIVDYLSFIEENPDIIERFKGFKNQNQGTR